MSRLTSSVLAVPHAQFALEDPWLIPAVCPREALLDATDGGRPRLSTTVAAYRDAEHLYVVFEAEDEARIVASMLEHDAPLWKEDVVELFVSPGDPAEYFEFEASPRGATFDARIVSPHGERSTMRADVGWDCAGLAVAVRRIGGEGGRVRASTLLRIPFASLGVDAPREGASWRANFFRIDRAAAGDEYSAWQPTFRNPPDFHVAAAFGHLRFS